MLGALAGDIIGSVYEFTNTKSTEFDLFTPWTKFTDDSVMTLAVAKWLELVEGEVLGLEAAITQICPKAMVVPKAIPQGHTNKKMSAQSQRTHQNVFTF